ncbi:glycerol-3-phosphate acyltransferase, partial [Bacillus cereus]|nr:glycerol-3-phosphate acyltransferase [Bacillus cereus]
IAFLVSAFIFYRHKENILRIKNHTESRIPFGLNSSKKKN